MIDHETGEVIFQNFAASDSVKEITTALIAARGEIPAIKMDAKNPHFDSRYASLSAVIETVTPVLTKHGVLVVQAPFATDGVVGVKTMLVHTSGEFYRSTLGLKPSRFDPQGAGSAITYARRYALSAMLNLATEADDDGNAATGGKPKDPAAPPAPRTPPRKRATAADVPGEPAPAVDPERERVYRKIFALIHEYALMTESGRDLEAEFKDKEKAHNHAILMRMYGKRSLHQLTADDLQDFIGKLETRISEASEGFQTP